MLPSKLRVPAQNGLLRERLVHRLKDQCARGSVLLVAPAGWGKTTVLAQLAAAVDTPVAWFTSESSERDAGSMLRYLEGAIRRVFPDLRGSWSSIEDAAAEIDSRGRSVLLIVDDLHALRSSPAEEALGRLLRFAPTHLGIVVSSRSYPAFNVSRLRLGGFLHEIGADDLRFRTWEVERLFADFYGSPLPPEELAELARRTNGWAAGLHMFHLATDGRAIGERSRKLATLNGSTKLVREYLADNVVSELPIELRRFLIDTSVLGRLSGTLCDDLLGTSESATILQELEERQLFLAGNDEEGYRCHEVLRSHLEALLVQEVGEEEARKRFAGGAAILERAGAHSDALYSYCRAEEWETVARLVDRKGEQLAGNPQSWIDRVPPGLAWGNPWLLLGAARRQRQNGYWSAAMELYSQAENEFTLQSRIDVCRSERASIKRWMTPANGPLEGWDGIIRRATVQAVPSSVFDGAATVQMRVAAGIAALLGGRVREAEAALTDAVRSSEASEILLLGARLGLAVARLLQGEDLRAAPVAAILEDAERAQVRWLAWMSRAVLALTQREDGLEEAERARSLFEQQDDAWGTALAGLLHGLGAMRRGEDPRSLARAAEDFARLDATVLEAWCRCTQALWSAESGAEARDQALQAESIARAASLAGPICYAYEALAKAEPVRREAHLGLAEQIRRGSGLLRLPQLHAESEPAPVPVLIRCFGEFQVHIRGVRVDLMQIKPRARQLFRLLALHSSQPVHREVLGEALWPGSESEVVRRNIQVAVHAVRRLIGGRLGGIEGVALARIGDSYSLQLPPGSLLDLREFERCVAEGKHARACNEDDRAAAAYERALDLHTGDLLAEDGPAEWVVMERERCRAQAVEAAESLADIQLRRGDLDAAAAACELGLGWDRYRDGLWRRLVSVHEKAGNRAAEKKTRALYASMLADLGLAEKPAI